MDRYVLAKRNLENLSPEKRAMLDKIANELEEAAKKAAEAVIAAACSKFAIYGNITEEQARNAGTDISATLATSLIQSSLLSKMIESANNIFQSKTEANPHLVPELHQDMKDALALAKEEDSERMSRLKDAISEAINGGSRKTTVPGMGADSSKNTMN